MIGAVDSASGLGLHDHLCWVYDDPLEYRSRVSEFFAEGLQHGLRVVYAGRGKPESLRADLAMIGDLDRLMASGAVRLVRFDNIYGTPGPVIPADVVMKYAAATNEALADGYRGLRVGADVTEIVRTPEQQEAFARCEFGVERCSARRPLSALCAYHVDLGDAVRDFACLHPAAPAGLAPFQFFACEDGAIGVLGEIDQSSESLFRRALRRVCPAPGERTLILDLSAVAFMDHRAVLGLDSFARASPVPVTLRSPPPVVRRIVQLLGENDVLSSVGIVR